MGQFFFSRRSVDVSEVWKKCLLEPTLQENRATVGNGGKNKSVSTCCCCDWYVCHGSCAAGHPLLTRVCLSFLSSFLRFFLSSFLRRPSLLRRPGPLSSHLLTPVFPFLTRGSLFPPPSSPPLLPLFSSSSSPLLPLYFSSPGHSSSLPLLFVGSSSSSPSWAPLLLSSGGPSSLPQPLFSLLPLGAPLLLSSGAPLSPPLSLSRGPLFSPLPGRAPLLLPALFMEIWAPFPRVFPCNKLGSVRHVCELQGVMTS